MTYDLQVFLYNNLKERDLVDILTKLKLKEERMEPDDSEFRIMSADTSIPLFSVDEVSSDFWDLAEDYADKDGGKIVREFDISSSHDSKEVAIAFSKLLVDSGKGFVFDPQHDSFIYPKVVPIED